MSRAAQPTRRAGQPLSVPNAVANMYYEFHIPLGLYNAIRELLAKQLDNPNLPNPINDSDVNREWFSQPRPATQGAVPKPTLLYATGTSHIFDIFGHGIIKIGGGASVSVPGLDGKAFQWDGSPLEDPFYKMLDSDLWITKRIEFADAAFPMINSLNEGVKRTIAMINDTPGSFALGGYSQGAAVMSLVYKEIQNGSLKHRKSDLIAGVTFGNPCRERGHLWPGANQVGGWDDPSSPSHGCFPQNFRLTGSETLWWDFANANEVISTISDAKIGSQWVDLVGIFLNGFSGQDMEAFIASSLSKLPMKVLSEAMSVLQSVTGGVGASGHVAYPIEPPPGDPKAGKTSYQIALQYLRDVGQQYKETRTAASKTEVLQVNFKLPMPINDLAFQAVQVPAKIDVWYQDRQDNWRAMLDENRSAVSVTLASSTGENWYPYHAYTAPTVAKAVQFRLTRIAESAMGTRPYCVGLRNILIRRNIYDRPAGIRSTTIIEDSLGNAVTTYLRDWDAPQAIDNNPSTFWRSSAQPTSEAVVWMCLDVRGADGSAQIIDTLYIDPVYTGNSLNIYYTNDEPEGVTLSPSPISLSPTAENYLRWQNGRGLWDAATGSTTSEFTAPFKVGPLVKQNCWIGVQWTPDFNATSPPGSNPILLELIPDNPQPGQFWPRLYYSVGNSGYGSIVLEFTNGTDSKTFSAPLSPPFRAGETLNIVAGWAYDAPASSVYISVVSKGSEIGSKYDAATLSLPDLINMSGSISFSKFRGLFTAHVVKLEGWLNSSASFLSNPVAYVDPDPITPDADGRVASSSLDNSVLSCDWTSQRYPVGGTSPSMHVDRRWTPIWRDYVVQRGRLYFPQQISMKYLKLEFSNLTAEPYPIYDTGIQVTYEVFPVSVYANITTTTTTTTTGPGTTTQSKTTPTSSVVHTPGGIEHVAGAIVGGVNGLLGSIGSATSGISSVNWLDPTSVNAAANAAYTSTVSPVSAYTSYANETGSIPNTLSTALGQSTGVTSMGGSIALREEATSTLVHRRSALNATTLAAHTVNETISTSPNQGLGSHVSTPIATAISEAFAPTIPAPSLSTVVPTQGNDFWLFPGGLLKMAASVMHGIYMGIATGLFGTNNVVNGTKTSTIIVPSTTSSTTTTATTQRLRFDTTETHVYRKMVVTRTNAIGYFAGIREIAAYSTTYIDFEDPVSFDFKIYDPKQWFFTNIKQVTSGAVTSAGTYYDTDLYTTTSISAWDAVGDWKWDGTQDNYSGNRIGAATIQASGSNVSLTSKNAFSVKALDKVVIKASVKYTGAVSTSSGSLIMDIITYSNGSQVGTVSLTPVTTSSVTASKVSITNPTGKTDGVTFTHLLGTYSVPSSGVDAIKVRFRINNNVTQGQFWIAEIAAETDAGAKAYLHDRFITFSKFNKIVCDFRDSGLRRSDSMWARKDPLNTNIDKGKLAWYATPTTLPAGMWGDEFAEWSDSAVKWGNARNTTSFPSTVTAAGTTTLTIASSQVQEFTGQSTQTVKLPTGSGTVSTTAVLSGAKYVIINNSTGVVTVKSSAAATITTLAAGTEATFTALQNNPTASTHWSTGTIYPSGKSMTTNTAIWIDPDRQYKGNQALRFRRAAGSGSAGIRVVQQTNYLPGALCRIVCVFYKPMQNNNVITLRLRRISDGLYVREEVISQPPVDQWYTYTSDFFELDPNSLDHVYTVEVSLTGTYEDDLYVSDLYTEISHIRYFMKMGGVSNPNAPTLEVTEMAYAPSDAIVTCTDPTNEVVVDAVILSDRAAAYGVTLTPVYQQ
jgi:hypothetical protein